MADIYKAGLFYVRDGRVLLCRKSRSTSLLILPGGKLEEGETAEQCLRRECCEELGQVEITNLTHLGTYESFAAGDESRIVRIELFTGDLNGTPAAQSEIKELVWFGPDDDEALLAPSLRETIFPDLRHQGLMLPKPLLSRARNRSTEPPNEPIDDALEGIEPKRSSDGCAQV